MATRSSSTSSNGPGIGARPSAASQRSGVGMRSSVAAILTARKVLVRPLRTARVPTRRGPTGDQDQRYSQSYAHEQPYHSGDKNYSRAPRRGRLAWPERFPIETRCYRRRVVRGRRLPGRQDGRSSVCRLPQASGLFTSPFPFSRAVHLRAVYSSRKLLPSA